MTDTSAVMVNNESVTSTFALAWAERRIGPMQSHRRFLDYVIDGDSFYRRHGLDRISVLGWFFPEQDDLAAQRMLGSSTPGLEGRTAVAVCPEDGDLLCDALTARIVQEGREIHWIDLAESSYDFDSQTWQHDALQLAGAPELRFEAEQYRAVISQRPSPDRSEADPAPTRGRWGRRQA